MIYTVKWNDDPDYAYHVEMTDEEKQELHDRMTASEEIETFEIYPIPVNGFKDILETLEDWEV